MRKIIGLRTALITAVIIVLAACLLWVLSSDTADSIQATYASGDLSGTLVLTENQHPADATQLLLAANCYRQLGQFASFQQCLERARELASDPSIELALAMYQIQDGQFGEPPEKMLDILKGVGASATEARSVVIQGCHAKGQLEKARKLLDAWRREQPHSAQQVYLDAMHQGLIGNLSQAESLLIANIDRHPRHELSWLALVELYSNPLNARLPQAELVLQRCVANFPYNTEIALKLARICRHLGHAAQAEAALAGRSDTGFVLLENAKLAYDQGDYGKSLAWLKSARLSTPVEIAKLVDDSFRSSLQGRVDDGADDMRTAQWCATVVSLSGDPASANKIFELAEERVGRLRRLQDLYAKYTQEETPALLHEIESTADLELAFERATPTPAPLRSLAGFSLYVQHCGACHGVSGDGQGYAACELFPAPRNFRDEPMRFVSAENRLATDDDLERTIRNGLEGTSMPAFSSLSPVDLSRLLEVVRWFRRQGLNDRYSQVVDDTDDVDQAAWIAARNQPSKSIAIPRTELDVSTLARGKELFTSVGCIHCHTANQAIEVQSSVKNNLWFDSLGRPLLAPNLSRDALRGGSTPEDIYKRIVLGIPGTPHPALTSATDKDAEAITAYILSVRQLAPVKLSNFERGARVQSAP